MWFQGHAEGKVLLQVAGKSLGAHVKPVSVLQESRGGTSRETGHLKHPSVGSQSPGSGIRRFVAALCREGKWPRLRAKWEGGSTGQG